MGAYSDLKKEIKQNGTSFKLNEDYVNSFVSDAQSFFSGYNDDIKNLTYGTAKDTHNKYNATYADLVDRANYIRTAYKANKANIAESDYNDMMSYLDSVIANSSQAVGNLRNASDSASRAMNQIASSTTPSAYASISSKEDFEDKSGNRELNPSKSEIFNNPEATITDRLGAFMTQSSSNIHKASSGATHGGGGWSEFGENPDYTVERYNQGADAWNGVVEEGTNRHWDKLTDNEVAIYYYLMNTEGQESANKFLEDMDSTLGQRYEQSIADVYNDSNILMKIAMQMATVPASVYGGALAFADDVVDLINGEKRNYYGDSHFMQNYAETIRGTVANDINSLTGNAKLPWIGTSLGDVYQALASAVDSVVGAKTLGQAYTFAMGMGAGSSTAKDTYERGGNEVQQTILGGIAAVAETAFEMIPMKTFLAFLNGKNTSTKKQLIKQLLKQSVEEAGEEIGTEATNIIADALVMRDASEWQKLYDEGGFTHALSQSVAQVLNAGAGGFISGAAMTGAGTVNAEYHTVKSGQSIYQNGGKDILVGIANNAELSKDSQKLLGKVNAITDSKKPNVFDYRNIGKLNQSVEYDNNVKAYKSEISARLAENNIDADEKTINKVYNYLTNDDAIKITDKYTRAIAEQIKASDNFEQAVANRVNNLNNKQVVSSVIDNGTTKKFEDQYGAKVAESGKTTNTKTGAEITNLKIESNDNGQMVFTVGKNDKVNSTDVEYANLGQAILYEGIKELGLSATMGNYVVNSADAVGLAPARYMTEVKLATTYGMTNQQDRLAYLDLPEQIRNNLFDEGRRIAKASDAEREAKVKTRTVPYNHTTDATFHNNIEAKYKHHKLTSRQEGLVRVAKFLAKNTYLDIHLIESHRVGDKVFININGKEQETGANGWYQEGTNKIYIDINAGANFNGLGLFTLSHEIGHAIRNSNPVAWREMADLIVKTINAEAKAKGQKNFQDMLNDKQTLYEKHRKTERATIEKAKKEGKAIDEKEFTYANKTNAELEDMAYEDVVCDALESIMADKKTYEEFATQLQQKSPSTWEKFKKIIRDFLNKIDRFLKGYEEVDPDSSAGKAIKYAAEEMRDEIRSLLVSGLIGANENYNNSTTENSVVSDSSAEFSLREKDTIERKAMAYYENNKSKLKHISDDMVSTANDIINEMAEKMLPYLDINNNDGKRYLPEEILGKTTFQNGSYGRTIENTTICFRTLAYIDFTNEIKKKIGRPLTVEESFLASQMLYDIAKEPQCLYCYVSLDRKAYDEFLIEYIKQRDEVLDKFANLKNKSKKNIDNLYKEFLDGRKDTKPMKQRFNLWINSAIEGKGLISLSDLTTEEVRSQLKSGELAKQINDAERYAQSASWAKKLEQYRAYNSDILNMPTATVKKLNEHYGLRFYSFSEYSPAFIVENMQQIRDASLKGLYGLAYTKKTDFARIFANTGININISVFGKMSNGKVVPDVRQGADWDEVKDLRNKHKNVGAVFVATSDELTRWALNQDWIDVVIPFHIVRTGANVAEFYKWTNNTKFQNDVDANGANKTISPAEHHNDRATFEKLIKERGLTPRFAQFLDETNYMKLVNETRLSDTESSFIQPIFDLDEAKKSFDAFVNDGGYYGDWYNEDIDYNKAVNTVAEDILAGKRANEVDYGRQDIDVDEQKKQMAAYKKNPSNKEHGKKFSFRGENSELENKNLEVAKEMETEGKDSETIRLATGWFKSYDGKWRYEIDDSKAVCKVSDMLQKRIDQGNSNLEKLNNDYKNGKIGKRAYENKLYWAKYFADKEVIRYSFESSIHTLGEILKHPELYKAYPKLKDVTVLFRPLDSGSLGVTYGAYSNIVINKNLLLRPGDIKSVLMHEIQHQIQGIEGFEEGTNTTAAKVERESRIAESEYALEEVKKAYKEYRDYILTLNDPNYNEYYEMQPSVVAYEYAMSKYVVQNKDHSISLERFGQSTLERATKRAKAGGYLNEAEELFRRFKEYEDIRFPLAKMKGYSPFDMYQKKAGEIEARDVESRLNLSKKERKSKRPDIDNKSAWGLKFSDRDSEGNTLTKTQQNFFKNSKARDEQGRLKRLYHGTTEVGFTIFDGGRSDDGFSFFFTDSESVADTYSGSELSIKFDGYSMNNLDDFNELIGLMAVDQYSVRAYKAFEENGEYVLKSGDIYEPLLDEDGNEIRDNRDMLIYNYDTVEFKAKTLNEILEKLGDASDYGIEPKGTYEVYLNLENPLIVNADGSNWDSLNIFDIEGMEEREDEFTYVDIHIDSKVGNAFSFSYGLHQSESKQYVMTYSQIVSEFGKSFADYIKHASYGWHDDVIIDKNGDVTDVLDLRVTRDFCRYAKNNGYDGVIFKDIQDSGGYGSYDETSNVYVAFSSNQIKSANNKKPTKKNPDIRYSDRLETPVFYSYMSKVVDGIKIAKMGANGVIPYLKGKGVKDEEIKWSGIATFLEGKKSVTKEELQEFAKNSMLKIEEKILNVDTNLLYDSEAGRNISREDFIKECRDYADSNEWTYKIYEKDKGIEVKYFDEDGDVADSYSVKYSDGRKWTESKLKTEGGTNYRELIFKMSGSTYSNSAMKTHWGEMGVLAHARIQDFDTPNGKMLFVEEIQSDWHNKGHKNGYITESERAKIDSLFDEANSIASSIYKEYPEGNFGQLNAMDSSGVLDKSIGKERADEFRKRRDKITELRTKARKMEQEFKDAANDAPFRDGKYVEFVMKRLLRLAAEEGYSSIGWTDSEMQLDRWNPERKINEEYLKPSQYKPEKAKEVAFKEGYIKEYDRDIPNFMTKYGKQWGAKVEKSSLFGMSYVDFFKLQKKIDKLIGEVSKKTGIEYDAIESLFIDRENTLFPSEIAEVSKYLEEIGMMSELEKFWDARGKKDTEVWSVTLTDAMKDSVITEGQALYQEREKVDAKELGDEKNNQYYIDKENTAVINIASYGMSLNKDTYKGVISIIHNSLMELNGENVVIKSDNRKVFFDEVFANEYTRSSDSFGKSNTKRAAKMNAIPALKHIVENATLPRPDSNRKPKHNIDAKRGFMRYSVDFGITDLSGDVLYFSGELIVRMDANGKDYVYDIEKIRNLLNRRVNSEDSQHSLHLEDSEDTIAPSGNSVKLNSDRAVADEIKTIIGEDDNQHYFGIRFDSRKYDVGSPLPVSHQLFQDQAYDLDDNPIYPEGEGYYQGYFDGGELNGTSSIGISFSDSIQDIEDKLKRAKQYSFKDHKYCYLIEGDYEESGNDYQESIIENAKVRKIFDYNGSEYSILSSDRDLSLDTRTLLSNALASTVQNDIEKAKIEEYQKNIAFINEEQKKLIALRAEIKDIAFSTGKRDMEKYKSLQAEATKTANRINIYDKKLLQLESTKPLKDVVEREKQKALKKAKEEYKSSLEAYRERAMQDQQNLIDRYQKRIESRKMSELRQKIKKLVEQLSRRELNPKANRYIPQDLIKPVADLLSALNVGTGKSERVMDKLYALKVEYDKIKNDPKYSISYDATVSDMVDELIAEVGNTTIYDMTYGQLLLTYNTLTAMMHTITTAVKVRNIESEKNAFEIAHDMRLETEAIPKGNESIPARYLQTMLRPETMFERFAGFKKDSMWSKVYQMLNKGQLNKMRIEMEANAIFKEVFRDIDYVKSLSDYKNLVDIGLRDDNGESVKVTRGMALAIYRALMNEDNARHIMMGGITVPDIKKYYSGNNSAYGVGSVVCHGIISRDLVENQRKLSDAQHELENLKQAQSAADEVMAEAIQNEIDAVEETISSLKDERNTLYDKGNAYLTEINDNIKSMLTDKDRAFLEATAEFFDEYCKKELNATTMELYGFEKALIEHYLPIHTDPDFRSASFESITRDMNLENSGFMKDRVNASNPIMLEDLAEIINSQIDKVSTYCGFTIPVKDFNKIYGKVEKGFLNSLQRTINEKFGKPGKAYIENLMSDIVGSRASQGTFFDRARGYMAGATLSVNPRVALAQAASLPTAASELGWGAIGRNLGKFFTKHDTELIAKYTPLLYNRSKGANIEVADIKKLSQMQNRLMRKLNWLMGWIEMMDKRTVGTLWYASQDYVRHNFSDLKVGTDEYYEKVAEVFNRTVERTQPNYATLQRPDVLRNPNAVVKQLTMFMTQRLQNFNIVYESIAKLNKYSADLKANRNGVTAEDVTNARNTVVASVTSQITAGAMIVGIKFVVDVLFHSMNAYRDDDEELTEESILLKLLDNFLDSMMGNVLGGSEVYTIINRIVTKERYYGISLSGVGAFGDVLEDFVALGQKVSPKNCNELAKSVCTLFGIPLGNAEKLGWGIWLQIKDIANGQFGSFESGVDRTITQSIHISYKAYLDGNTKKFESIKIPDKNQGQVTSYLKPLYFEAYDKNDTETMANIRKYMKALGMYDDVVSTTQNWIKNRNK